MIKFEFRSTSPLEFDSEEEIENFWKEAIEAFNKRNIFPITNTEYDISRKKWKSTLSWYNAVIE